MRSKRTIFYHLLVYFALDHAVAGLTAALDGGREGRVGAEIGHDGVLSWD